MSTAFYAILVIVSVVPWAIGAVWIGVWISDWITAGWQRRKRRVANERSGKIRFPVPRQHEGWRRGPRR